MDGRLLTDGAIRDLPKCSECRPVGGGHLFEILVEFPNPVKVAEEEHRLTAAAKDAEYKPLVDAAENVLRMMRAHKRIYEYEKQHYVMDVDPNDAGPVAKEWVALIQVLAQLEARKEAK